jgi:hypothetical protein
MADFFFFTDVESILSQEIGDNFGPISNTEYNLDSFQTVTENANAYAICDSLVLVQESNDGHLNIILKPLTYPDFNIGRIEYFIFKGIKKSSLINGNEVAIRTSNDLTENLWLRQEQTDKNSGSTPSNPLKKHLGVDYISSGIDVFKITEEQSIESVFFKEGDIQLAKVKGGDSIGQFVGGSTKCGVQIIVERVGFYPSMELARKGKHKLNISEPLGTTQYQQFLHYHLKEEILNYIDPVSFLGMFSQSKNKLIIKSLLGSTIELPNLIQKFHNKNRIYLDIRNEYDKSFNYYQLYGPSIGFSSDSSLDATSITQYNFYTQNASSTGNYGLWPIFIIEGEPILVLSENELHGKLFLKIPDVNNVLSGIYIQNGWLNGLSRENKFEFNVTAETIIELTSWKYNDGGTNFFGSAYLVVKTIYDKTKNYEGFFNSNNDVISHIFDINNLKVDFSQNVDDVAVKVFHSGTIIEKNFGAENFGDTYTACVGIAKDFATHVLFTSASSDIGFLKNPADKPNFEFISGLYKRKISFLNNLEHLTKNFECETFEHTQETSTLIGLTFLKTSHDSLDNNFEPTLFDCIQLTHAEFNQLVTLSNSNFISDFSVYISTKRDDTTFIEFERYQFKTTQITLEGLSFAPGSSTDLEKKIVDTNIFINSYITKI